MKKILEVRGQQAQDILSMLKHVATAGDTLELHEVHRDTMAAFATAPPVESGSRQYHQSRKEAPSSIAWRPRSLRHSNSTP